MLTAAHVASPRPLAWSPMPRKPKSTPEERLDALESDVTEIRADVAHLTRADAEIDSLKTDVAGIRRELARHGVGPIENPGRKAAKITTDAHAAIRRQNAKVARAAKDVGRGQGKVRTSATKTKLEAEAGVRRKGKR